MYKRAYKAAPTAGRAGRNAQVAARRQSYRAGLRAANRAKNARTSGFVDIENKFLDSELTATALTAGWVSLNPTGTGCTDSISVPAQGDGESERDGRVYHINSVHVKGLITKASDESTGSPLGDCPVRVILYWDTQTNASEAVATDIMDAGGTTDLLAFRNLQNSKRFVVLKDKTMMIRSEHMNEGAVNSFAHSSVQIPFQFNKKFKKPIKVRCAGTTANVSSVQDNNLGIAAITGDAAQGYQIQYQARIRFTG